MNKISSILPTSHRIESVDYSQERPTRAGAANIGQPTVKATERPSLVQKETVGGLSSEDFEVSLKKPGQKSEEKVVNDIASDFFLKRRMGDTVAEEEPSVDGQKLSIRV